MCLRLVLAPVVVLLAACPEKPAARNVTPTSTSTAAAAADVSPATPPPPSPAELENRYRVHLRSGRELAGEKKWNQAVVAFEAALVARPGDGRALSELGWAAFNMGDLDKARRASSEAARSSDPKVRAQALYNWGRVEEASGQKDEAIQHYRESRALRPNRTVDDRLTALGIKLPPRKKGPTGVLLELQNGDRACYVVLRTKEGEEHFEGDFELCPYGSDLGASKWIGKRVTTTTEEANVLASECEGDMDCGKSDVVDLIVTVSPAQ